MANLYGTGINQVPTNGMLGNLAFQDKAYVSVDKVGIGTTFVDSGTANQILQVYGGGAYVSGSVGIGSTNPTSTLSVLGGAQISGNLGIGVTNPSYNLVIENPNTDSNNLNSLIFEGSGAWMRLGDPITARTFTNGIGIKLHDQGSQHYSIGQIGGNFLIANTSANGAQLFPNTTNTTGILLNSSGNVGINTNNPQDTLQVNGDLRLQAAIPEIKFRSEGNVNQYYIGANISDSVDGGFIIGEGSGITGGTTRFLIDTNGNVGINSSTPTSRLDVIGGVKVLGVVTATSFVGIFSGSIAYAEVAGIASAISTTVNVNTTGVVTATRFSTGASGTGINIDTNSITGPSQIILDPAGVGDNTGSVRIRGDLFVDGTQTYINSTTIELADFNVGIATTVSSNSVLDGAGIGIGATEIRKTLTWSNASTSLKSSEDFDLASGKSYKINGNTVLSSTTLGSGVVNSSLTSVGTLGQLNVSGVSTFGGNVRLGDNDVLYFGDDNDLEIYHSGSTSFILDNGTGNLALGSNGDRVSIVKGTGTETLARFNIDDSVELWFNNVKQFETTGYGATVFGVLQSQGLQISGISTFNNELRINDNVLISANSADDLVRINQTGTGNALVVEDSANPDSTPFVINASGFVGVGTTAPAYSVHIRDNLSTSGGIFVESNSTAFTSPIVRVRGVRSDSNTSQCFSGQLVLEKYQTSGATTSGRNLGAIIFGGNFDTSPGITTGITYGASIGAMADGTFSDINTAPTAIVFNTGSVGLGTLGLANVNYGTEAARITSNRNLLIGATSETGTASQRLQVTGGAYVSTALGIGRTNPGSYALDVNGIARIGGAAAGKVSFGTGMAAGEFGLQILPYSDRTELQAEQQGSAYRPLVLQPFGSNVGIGTTNATNRLTVWGTNNDTTPILALLSGNNSLSFNSGAQIAFGYNGSNTYQHFIQTRHNSANSDNAIDFYVSDGTQNNTLTSGSVHTLSLVSGNVGVGTFTPSQKLDVRGLTQIVNSQSQLLIHPDSNAATVIHRNDASDYYILLSNAGTSPSTTWNGLRPFSIVLSTGRLNSLNGQYFDGTTTIGTSSTTGTTSQLLQVSGGAYFSSNVGIAATNPLARLSVGSGSLSDGNLPVQISTQSLTGQTYYGANNNGSYGALFGYDRAGFTGGVIRVVGSTDNIEFVVNNTTRAAIINSNGNVGIGTTIALSTLDVRGVPWFTPNTDGTKAVALRLGRFFDSTNSLFDILTDDTTGDDLEFRSNRFTGSVKISRGSPTGIHTVFTLASNYLSGSSISIADTTGTTTKIRLDEAANTYFNNTGSVLVGTISSTNTVDQKLQVVGGAYVSGDVGIGSITPKAKLDVLGTVRVSSGSTFDGAVTFNSAVTFNNTISQGNFAATFSQTSQAFTVGSQTSGALTLGGTSQTGAIILGRSTSTHTLNIDSGASTSGVTKTINVGVGGLSGSFTQINIGPTAGVGTVAFNSGTNIGIGTTIPTRAVDILSDLRIRGSLYDKDNDVGFDGQVLVSTGSGVNWVTASSAIGGLVGVNIQDEGVGIGTTVPTLNFTGDGIQATVSLQTATINVNSTSANTGNTIVFRDGSGNFSAGTITASLSGNATSSNTSGYATTAGISTNVVGAAQRILYNSTTDTTTTSSNLTYNGSTLTHTGTFNQNGTMNVYQVNLPQNPNNAGFGTTTANPQYYIGQTMGDNDYWKIYGESPSGANTGTMVFEVQDDIDNSERFAFRTRRTYSTPGFTTALLLDTSQAVFSGAITGTNLTLTNPTNALISGPASITIDPATVGNETGVVRIRGDLIVDGTQTQVNSTTIDFADLNVGIATTVGTDLLLDGGGIGIGSTNIRKTITWNNTTSSLKSSESWDIASGKVYKIDGVNVLTSNTLGAGILNSSLTSVGTLSSLNVTGTISAGANIEFSNTNTQRGIFGTNGTNDYWFVGGAASGASAGYLEIATGDDANEPIYVRQYTGSPLSGTATRTLTLLDSSGDTSLPGSLTIGGGFSLNNDLTVSGYVYRGAAIKTASLFIRGTGLNAAANRLVYLNGTAVVNDGANRGLTLTIIGAGLTHISSTNYDTFGDPAASNNLATAIGIVSTGQIAVLTSYDAWEGNITNNLRAAALKVGLSKLANYGAGGSRRPYAAVFYGSNDDPNAAPHDVIERMESDDADAPRATIHCNLATEGTSIGIQGAVSVNALYSPNSATEDPVVYVDSNSNTTVAGILTATSGINIGTNVVVNSSGNIYFDGVPTVVNQNRGIYWTAYDKETVADFSDAAHIRHTVSSGGLTGSVIEIRSDNDATDGVNIIVAASDGARINGNTIWHAGNDGAGTGLDADLLDGLNSNSDNVASTIVARNALGGFSAGIVTCTDLNSTSDVRLKTAIRPIDDPLKKVLSIRGVNFEWREDHRQSAGVIAQEVEQVLPELVMGDKTKTVNYNGLIGVLIEAIKEQQKQIDALQKKIDSM